MRPLFLPPLRPNYVLATTLSVVIGVSACIGICHAADYPAMQTQPGWSRSLQRVLGLNILSRVIATHAGEKILRNEFDGELTLKLKSYSAFDLLGRRLKHMELYGADLKNKDLPTIQRLHVASDLNTPMWMDKKTNRLKRPVTFHVQATLTEDDLNNYLKTAEDKNHLHFDVPLPPFKHHEIIKLSDARIDLKPGLVKGHTVANIKGAPKSAGVAVNGMVIPKVSKGQLVMHKVDLRIPQIDEEYAQYLERFLQNSLLQVIDMNTLVNIKHHRSRIAYKQIAIHDDRIDITADLTISPKTK